MIKASSWEAMKGGMVGMQRDMRFVDLSFSLKILSGSLRGALKWLKSIIVFSSLLTVGRPLGSRRRWWNSLACCFIGLLETSLSDLSSLFAHHTFKNN